MSVRSYIDRVQVGKVNYSSYLYTFFNYGFKKKLWTIIQIIGDNRLRIVPTNWIAVNNKCRFPLLDLKSFEELVKECFDSSNHTNTDLKWNEVDILRIFPGDTYDSYEHAKIGKRTRLIATTNKRESDTDGKGTSSKKFCTDFEEPDCGEGTSSMNLCRDLEETNCDEGTSSKRLWGSVEETEYLQNLFSNQDKKNNINIGSLQKDKFYVQSLKVRVSSTPIFSNKAKKRLQFYVMDESGTIPFVAIGDMAENIKPFIRANTVYVFQNFKVSSINPQHPRGDYQTQIVFQPKTTYKEVDEKEFAKLKFNVIGLNEARLCNGKFDVLGILIRNSDTDKIKFFMYNLDKFYADRVTGIPVLVMDKLYESFSFSAWQTVLLKNVNVEFYNGQRCISVGDESFILVNPSPDDITSSSKK